MKELGKGKNLPAILTGDFNVDQTHQSYDAFVSKGVLCDSYEKCDFRYATNGTFNDFDPNSFTETLLWDLQKAETELWKEPPEPLLDEIAELVMKDNPYWEGSPTALVALINMDIQPHVITRKLNVLAGRLYTEHGILFRSERVHEGRKLRFWKDNTENA